MLQKVYARCSTAPSISNGVVLIVEQNAQSDCVPDHSKDMRASRYAANVAKPISDDPDRHAAEE